MLVCLNSDSGLLPPHCPQGHGQPQGANQIDPRYSADALKAISDLQLGSCPQAILKVRQPSSLVYRPRHRILPDNIPIVEELYFYHLINCDCQIAKNCNKMSFFQG